MKLSEKLSQKDPKILFIVVPGIETPAPDTWSDTTGLTWLKLLPERLFSSPTVYEFDHGLDLNQDYRCWDDILEKGSDLLDSLSKLLQRNERLRKCPLIIIAQSLGGIIAKKCITRILERPIDFPELAFSFSAFVAIGVPHSRSADANMWNQPQALVASKNRSKRGRATSKSNARELADLCTTFEELVADRPTLSLCEGKETTMKSIFLIAKGSNKAFIVPRSSCEIESRLGTFFKVENATHFDLCHKLPPQQFGDFIAEATRIALARIIRSSSSDISIASRPKITMQHVESQTQNEQLEDAARQDSKLQDASHQATVAASDYRKQGLKDLADFSALRRDPLLPCHVISGLPNPDLMGRSDVLEKLEEVLNPVWHQNTTTKSARSFALCGPGGIGKTQVANEYALTHTDIYEAILWIDAEYQGSIPEQFNRIAIMLGLVLEGSRESQDQVLTRELVKGWLAKPVRSYNKTDNHSMREVHWLLIFDNVESPDSLVDFWPSTGSIGSILITTRDTRAAKPGLYPVDNGMILPPLAIPDASALLLKLTWRMEEEDEQELSSQVAETLGGLPLALVRMAGVAISQQITFAAFLTRYEEEATHDDLFLRSEGPSFRRTGYEHTLASVWKLEKLECGSGLLDVMAFLDPSGISEDFLESMLGKALLLDYPKTVKEYHDARAELLRHSLIGFGSGPKVFTMHRVIQDNVRAKLLSDPSRLRSVFDTAVAMLFKLWPVAELGIRHHIARWSRCASLATHVERLREHYVRAGEASKAIWMHNFSLSFLLNETGWYFQERGRTADAMILYDTAKENILCIIERQNNLSNTSEVVTASDKQRALALLAETHNNIAGVETELNHAENALYHFTIYNKMLTEEHRDDEFVKDPRLTSSFFNVGMSYLMKDDFDQAVPWFKDAIHQAKRLQDPTKIKLAQSLGLINLGLAYNIMGDQESAQEQLTTALEERVALLGPNDRQSMITGRVWYCLGNVRRAQGDLDESLACHETALLHFRETVGDSHHRTGNSCFKVAEHYVRLDRHADALSLLERALTIFKGHDWYQGEEGRVLLLQSYTHLQLSKSDEAKKALIEAQARYTSLAGSEKVNLTTEDFAPYIHVWGR